MSTEHIKIKKIDCSGNLKIQKKALLFIPTKIDKVFIPYRGRSVDMGYLLVIYEDKPLSKANKVASFQIIGLFRIHI